MTKPSNYYHPRKPSLRQTNESDGVVRPFAYVTLVLTGIAVLIWWSLQTPPEPAQRIVVSPPAVTSEADKHQEVQRRIRFFEAQVLAELQTTDEANRLAAERCIQRIEQNFNGYRDGVSGFVDEITGIGSRFGILRRMPGDWWSGNDRVQPFVTEKFAKHIFSEARLTADLRKAMETFRDDIRSNQQALLSRTQAAVDQADLPPINLDDYESFFSAINKQINQLAGNEAKTSVSEGIIALVVSEAGSTAVGMIVGRFVAGLTVSTASAVAASGGATAGSAAAGAAGGSFIPGAGTLVGFGVGLAVGFGVDYWMNQQTAEKLGSELIQYINQVEANLFLGSTDGPADRKTEGIRVGIDSACDKLHDGVHQRLYEIIVLEQSL